MKFNFAFFRPHIGKIAGALIGIALGLKLFGLIFGMLIGALADILLQDLRLRRSLQKNPEETLQSEEYPPELEFIINLTRKIMGALTLDFTKENSQNARTTDPNPTPPYASVSETASGSLHSSQRTRYDVEYLEGQILRHFHLTPRGRSVVHHICRANIYNYGYREASHRLSTPVELTPKDQLSAARLLFEAVMLSTAADHVPQSGATYVRESCISLGIKKEYLDIAAGIVIKQDSADYEVLGVAPESSTAEIKRVYRTLAAQFHPDSLHGLSSEQKNAATEAFIRIRTAYENIMRNRSGTTS